MSRFREIAPAPEAQETSSLGPPPHRSLARKPTPRRSQALKACVYCKTKKIKCSGGEPCFQCKSRRLLVKCSYDLSREEILRLENVRLQKRIQELELLYRPQPTEAFNNLRIDDIVASASDPGPDSGEASSEERLENESAGHFPQAFELLQLPYSPTESPAAVGYSPLPPSSPSRQTSTDPGKEYMLQPYAHLSLTNELATRYPSVYPALIHPDAERLGLQVIYDPSQILSHIDTTQLNVLANPRNLYSIPDNRLQNLNLTPWTDVVINADVAAGLLSQYFDNDHPAFRLFDADLFLDDLTYGRHLYCSPQLINALLAWACQAYHDLYPEEALQDLGLQFLAHADHLFWQPLNLNTITSAGTATLLEICAMMSGHADLSARYKAASLACSQVMGFFGAGDSFSASAIAEPTDIALGSSQWTRVTSHTAWGVFSHQTFTDLYSRSCAFQGSPVLPIPGLDTYHLDDGVLSIPPRPSYTDVSFASECQLAIIVHDMVHLYYYAGEPDGGSPLAGLPNRSPSLEQAENLFRRLLLWAAGLPLACVRGDQNSPATMVMHMHFHATVIALFQPFTFGPLQRLKFQSFANQGSALCAFNASVDQLKRLVISHQSTFQLQGNLLGPLSGSLALASSLCQNGPSVERKDDSVRHHYFGVCVKGLLRIVDRFAIIKVYIQGLLALALSTRTITTQYAEWVMGEVTRQTNPKDTPMAAEHLASNVVVDYELALSDRRSATFDKIAATLGDG